MKLRGLATLFRVGMSEAVAYRAEMLVWVLATTMPFINWMLWNAVSQVQPVAASGGHAWDQAGFARYFLAVFVVRQLLSSWAAWEINWEVKQGTLAMRLLRPVHPVLSYAASNLAALPLRSVVTLPVLAYMAWGLDRGSLPGSGRGWMLFGLSMFLGWCINFFVNIAVGALCFFLESSVKVMDVWLALFFVFSGYLFPLDLMPPSLRVLTEWLPFRYQISLPVELLTGRHEGAQALALLGRQALFALGAAALALGLWHRGLRRFQAVGG